MQTKLNVSTSFHPQTDGQIERTTQIVEDMLQACALEFKGSWDRYLTLIEFAYNNSYQAWIRMALQRHSIDGVVDHLFAGTKLGKE